VPSALLCFDFVPHFFFGITQSIDDPFHVARHLVSPPAGTNRE
jgi:hypothetical protein